MIVGVVDIGTNSMRLLVMDGQQEVHRDVEVTGLGFGVDQTGTFDERRVAATLEVLERYGAILDRFAVQHRRAVATSAARDVHDGAAFIRSASDALGVLPEVISGEEEAELSFLGAVRCFDGDIPTVVIDIGGGSTEFVHGGASVIAATSIDIGSVRLTDRTIPSRPAPDGEVERARSVAAEAFHSVMVPPACERVIGVGGTFTTLVAVALDLPSYDRERVHRSRLTVAQIRNLIGRFAGLNVDETAAVPSLDPNRAPVILAGAIVAEAALAAADTSEITISERDLLDGLALRVLNTQY